MSDIQPGPESSLEQSFEYVEVGDIGEADKVVRGVNLLTRQPRSESEIQTDLLKYAKERCWWEDPYWKEKGLPSEQIEVMVGEAPITIYNYNQQPLSAGQLDEAQEVFQSFAQHFPQAIGKIRYMAIDNLPGAGSWGDPVEYPINGSADPFIKLIKLYPRVLEQAEHRVAGVSNWKGTVAHETTHPIVPLFASEWKKYFTWESIAEDKQNYAPVPSPDGKLTWYQNKQTGILFPRSHVPDKPEACITTYGYLTDSEDICDSMVGYLFKRDALNKVSPTKLRIFSGMDANLPPALVSLEKVSPKLPTGPGPIKYFVSR